MNLICAQGKPRDINTGARYERLAKDCYASSNTRQGETMSKAASTWQKGQEAVEAMSRPLSKSANRRLRRKLRSSIRKLS